MDGTTKRCPLLLTAAWVKSDPNTPTFCWGKPCAWWDDEHDGRCALVSIAQSLDSLDMGGITVEMEATGHD